MPNKGIAPLQPETPVGQFRLLYGDTNYTQMAPPEAGFGDYTFFSDLEIEIFLSQGDSSPSRGVGYAYLQLAGAAAIQSKSVKDYDLSVDLTKRAGELRATATEWFQRAEAEDALSGANDAFNLFDAFGSPSCRHELAERPYCGCRGVLI